ncbi:AMP-binding protein [Actinomycetospora endophytica]|uniref:AMP-binding protein n=1 Tax=Actinomycetospora endophytica TaxID=2291215 RepID=A0ABS8PHA3_9PSEU|nr:AMP-binding protein [Actinomycetospora endophytica]MCD2197657.1 AMP-binding protein [Actinomycetospora endophytica]
MPSLEDLPGPSSVMGLLRRAGATAVNATDLLVHGGFVTDEQYSPYEVVSSHPVYKLRRYFPDEVPPGAPVMLLVHALMITGDVWDIAPDTSAVAALHGMGIDVWTIDFGAPEHEPGGLERTLTDHALAVSDAVDEVSAVTGRDVVLGGQSQGGMFCYQVAAYRRGANIDSLVTFGSPVDTRAPMGVPMSPETATTLAHAYLSSGLARRISIPGWAMRTATQMLTPIGVAKGKAQWYLNLHDRERLLPRERLRMYLDGQGWTAYAGPAFAELLEQFMVHNRMLEGGFVFRDRLVSLADIDVPILTVVGSTDLLATPPAVRGIRRAAPRAEVYELNIPIGHFGIIGGARARKVTWPTVGRWIHWRAGEGDLPEELVPANRIEEWNPGELSTVRRMIGAAADLSVGSAARAISVATGALRGAEELVRAGVDQLARLRELGDVEPGTRISLGLLLDEAAQHDPGAIVYAFGDRVIRHGEFKHRVDSIVAVMLGLGVRPGERIGVRMASRPSALSALAAISRLGATAVLLRPEGDLAREIRLGQVTRLVTDPENVPEAEAEGVSCYVLGAGSERGDLPGYVIDMEDLDPERVRVPAWYRPNPREAADLAFVLFTGTGAATRDMLITNRRWALSARGAAEAAGLTATDTVYSVTPLHHSSAILHAMAGAIASGARLALASGPDPDTFWDEVRRYGATHVSYTWTSLRAITDGPPHPGEPDHPIRVFMGSGMPPGLWRRVAERFAPARVVEVYASAEGEAILANPDGGKVGCVGRPLRGTPEVRVVDYALASEEIVTGPDGYALQSRPEAVGLLVVRGRSSSRHDAVPLRNLFDVGDVWLSTGDLFTRDADGDLWFVDRVRNVIRSVGGPVLPSVVSRALEGVPGVALATAYGVLDDDAGEVVVGAVRPLPGARLDAEAIERALRDVPRSQRPAYVQSVRIPTTAWARPQVESLRRAGIPTPRDRVTVWRLAADGRTFERLGRGAGTDP